MSFPIEEFLGKVCCGTGHRPPKLGGYSDEVWHSVIDLAVLFLMRLKPQRVITGMALGWDQALAWACMRPEVNIPFVAAIPFRGQAGRWPERSQREYMHLLANASEVVELHNRAPNGAEVSRWMQERNVWMVNEAEYVVALWDGIERGGTWNCVAYARTQNKPIVNMWQRYNTPEGGE